MSGPAGAEASGKADGTGRGAVRPGQTGKTALVDRLTVGEQPGQRTRERFVPFSHRSKRWHVYPFTSYGEATYSIALSVQDPKMEGRTAAWVFRRRGEQAWGEPVQTAYDRDGAIELTVESERYANYALVVGPRSEEQFLPRYPGDYLEVTDESGERHEARVEHDPETGRWWLWLEPGEQDEAIAYPIVDPRPTLEPDDPKLDDPHIYVKKRGRVHAYRPSGWRRPSFFYGRGDGTVTGSQLYVGFVEGDYYGETDLALYPVQDGKTDYSVDDRELYHVVLASSSEGEALTGEGRRVRDPARITAVPQGHEGREIHMIRSDSCKAEGSRRPECFTAAYGDDGTPVPSSLRRDFRQSYLDFGEPSEYRIRFSCDGDSCEPEAARRTRHPIYFAHGFNASAESWQPLLEYLRGRDPVWSDWVHAGDVPGRRPLRTRVEALRRNLEAFMDQLASRGHGPASGESFMRLNVIAHSMGGLDTRMLVQHRRYNREGCGRRADEPELQCFASRDRERVVPCCEDGIPWEKRIASLTTLSTPHLGSAFAEWTLETLSGGILGWLFERVAGLFGLDSAQKREAFRQTVRNLTRSHAVQLLERYPQPPASQRDYKWNCALSERCNVVQPGPAPDEQPGPIASKHLPQPGDGRFPELLPEPVQRTTIFSWGARACIDGQCGSFLAPELVIPYQVMKRRELGSVAGSHLANDGVVAAARAQYGIFMGVRPSDHFGWTRMEPGLWVRLKQGLFGVRREPVDRFYSMWLDALRRSGY